MAEHNEHESSPEGAAPEPQPPQAAAGGPGDRSATHAYEGAAPHPQAETLSTAAAPAGGGRWSGRFRRWSANGTVRMGAVTLIAGLVGGLVGGGIVAAFSDDGHDRAVPARFERGVQRDGPPGFYGPRYRGQPPNGRWMPNRVPQPNPPATPAPTPTG